MSFWKYLRDMFLFDWFIGKNRNGRTLTNRTHSDIIEDSDCDLDHEGTSQGISGYSHSSWDDGHYASEDYYHDSYDDYAHDFDDFEDDY